MNRFSFRWIWPAVAALCAAAASAAPVVYEFTPMASIGVLAKPANLRPPVLADDGRAAYSATPKRFKDTVLVRTRKDGRPATILAREGARFSRFGDLSISADKVAFEASLEQVRGEGIFRVDGTQSAVQIAGTRDAGDFDFVNAGPSVNKHGRVAFIGERIVGRDFIDGVYAGDGGPVEAVYDTREHFRDFTGNPAINDAGQVAFLADLRGAGGRVGGLFLGSGGNSFVTVADDRGMLTGILGFSDPSLNEHGEVAFSAGTNEDPDDNGSSTGAGIFFYSGGVLTTVLQGGFAQFFSLGEPSLNKHGQLAFTVEPNFGEQILVTGPDLAEDRVIATGQMLGGRTISGIAFGREGYNDAGQLAFIAFFADGTAQPWLATPVAGTARSARKTLHPK